MRTKLAAGALALALAGCSSGATQSGVYDAAKALTVADRAALIYVSLPRCPAPAPCSDPSIVLQIKAAAQKAHDAVKMAEADPTTTGVAAAAIAALVGIIPTH